ncbi:MAG: HAD superfamily hydrolase (TIGR01509 family) [Myxococcota bacterium]|jgi:HAD superfamily hydrolase (TIGR01509 family)
MGWHDGIQAVIFDLDGTLVDSECRVDDAVRAALSTADIDPTGVDYEAFYGRTWNVIAAELRAQYTHLTLTAADLEQRFFDLCMSRPPPPIPGAAEMVRYGAQLGPVAICTSSHRAWLEGAIAQLGIANEVTTTVCANDVTKSKPNPQPYLLAAERLKIAPAHCAVFEDSIPGLQAAHAAGMKTIAVLQTANAPLKSRALAAHSITNYQELLPSQNPAT